MASQRRPGIPSRSVFYQLKHLLNHTFFSNLGEPNFNGNTNFNHYLIFLTADPFGFKNGHKFEKHFVNS